MCLSFIFANEKKRVSEVREFFALDLSRAFPHSKLTTPSRCNRYEEGNFLSTGRVGNHIQQGELARSKRQSNHFLENVILKSGSGCSTGYRIEGGCSRPAVGARINDAHVSINAGFAITAPSRWLQTFRRGNKKALVETKASFSV